MATPASRDELYTTVENLLDTDRVFGFLGPRGMRLAAGEVVTVRGNLVATLGGSTSSRKFKALERAVASGSLRIRNTPAPIFWDATDEVAKTLSINNSVLGIVDPTYSSSDSANFAAV